MGSSRRSPRISPSLPCCTQGSCCGRGLLSEIWPAASQNLASQPRSCLQGDVTKGGGLQEFLFSSQAEEQRPRTCVTGRGALSACTELLWPHLPAGAPAPQRGSPPRMQTLPNMWKCPCFTPQPLFATLGAEVPVVSALLGHWGAAGEFTRQGMGAPAPYPHPSIPTQGTVGPGSAQTGGFGEEGLQAGACPRFAGALAPSPSCCKALFPANKAGLCLTIE